MAKNFLPFARRDVININNTGNNFATSITALSIGGGVKAHLGDLSISMPFQNRTLATTEWSTLPPCRIGILGKGYLTESFYATPIFNNGTVNETGVWKFPKPYRLYPGERMKAKFVFPAAAVYELTPGDKQVYYRPAVQFNCRRVKDNEPVLLYDAYIDASPGRGANILLNGDNLQCPADSPIDIYSVIGPTPPAPYWYGIDPEACPSFQIWGPDDRSWWDDPTWIQVTTPPNGLVDLNKPEWVLDPKEPITVEFLWPIPLQNSELENQDFDITVTLRGSLEVE